MTVQPARLRRPRSERGRRLARKIERPPAHWLILCLFVGTLVALLLAEGLTEHSTGASGTPPPTTANRGQGAGIERGPVGRRPQRHAGPTPGADRKARRPHLRRRARPQVDPEDRRHAQAAGRAGDLLRRRGARRREPGCDRRPPPGWLRDRQPHLQPCRSSLGRNTQGSPGLDDPERDLGRRGGPAAPRQTSVLRHPGRGRSAAGTELCGHRATGLRDRARELRLGGLAQPRRRRDRPQRDPAEQARRSDPDARRGRRPLGDRGGPGASGARTARAGIQVRGPERAARRRTEPGGSARVQRPARSAERC